MDCREVEIRLVHALDGENSAAVDEHLERCEPCRAFFAELLADRDALRGLGAEGLPEEALVELRKSVMQKIPGRRRALWWVPVAATLLLAVILWPRDEVAPPAAVVAAVKPPDIAWQRSKPQPAPALVNAAVAKPRPAARRRTVEQPLWVKLETPDPNVVIYWMVEPKGEME